MQCLQTQSDLGRFQGVSPGKTQPPSPGKKASADPRASPGREKVRACAFTAFQSSKQADVTHAVLFVPGASILPEVLAVPVGRARAALAARTTTTMNLSTGTKVNIISHTSSAGLINIGCLRCVQ